MRCWWWLVFAFLQWTRGGADAVLCAHNGTVASDAHAAALSAALAGGCDELAELRVLGRALNVTSRTVVRGRVTLLDASLQGAGITQVGGDFDVNVSVARVRVELPALRAVNGSLRVSLSGGVATLVLNGLASVQGDLAVQGAQAAVAESLQARFVRRIGGSVRVTLAGTSSLGSLILNDGGKNESLAVAGALAILLSGNATFGQLQMGLVSSIAAGLEVRAGPGVLVPGAAVTITGALGFQLSGGLTAAGNVPAITLSNVAGLSGSWSTSGGAESRKVTINGLLVECSESGAVVPGSAVCACLQAAGLCNGTASGREHHCLRGNFSGAPVLYTPLDSFRSAWAAAGAGGGALMRRYVAETDSHFWVWLPSAASREVVFQSPLQATAEQVPPLGGWTRGAPRPASSYAQAVPLDLVEVPVGEPGCQVSAVGPSSLLRWTLRLLTPSISTQAFGDSAEVFLDTLHQFLSTSGGGTALLRTSLRHSGVRAGSVIVDVDIVLAGQGAQPWACAVSSFRPNAFASVLAVQLPFASVTGVEVLGSTTVDGQAVACSQGGSSAGSFPVVLVAVVVSVGMLAILLLAILLARWRRRQRGEPKSPPADGKKQETHEEKPVVTQPSALSPSARLKPPKCHNPNPLYASSDEATGKECPPPFRPTPHCDPVAAPPALPPPRNSPRVGRVMPMARTEVDVDGVIRANPLFVGAGSSAWGSGRPAAAEYEAVPLTTPSTNPRTVGVVVDADQGAGGTVPVARRQVQRKVNRLYEPAPSLVFEDAPAADDNRSALPDATQSDV